MNTSKVVINELGGVGGDGEEGGESDISMGQDKVPLYYVLWLISYSWPQWPFVLQEGDSLVMVEVRPLQVYLFSLDLVC